MSNLQKTPIVDKNGKHTYVYKKTEDITNSRVVGLEPRASFKDEWNEEFDMTEKLLAEIFDEGGIDYKDGEYHLPTSSLGITKDGRHLNVNVVLKPIYDVTTTDLKELDKAWSISITGSTQSEDGSSWAAGLLTEELKTLETPFIDDYARQSFLKIWREYYINDSMYATENQYKKIQHLRDDGFNLSEDNMREWAHLVENDRGYELGESVDLVRLIRTETIANIIAITELASSNFRPL